MAKRGGKIKGGSMSKTKPGKGGDLTKPNIQSKVPALPDDWCSDEPMLPSIFAQGKDKKTVLLKIESNEAYESLKESLGTKNPHLWQLFLSQLGECGHKHRSEAENLNQLMPILHSMKPRDALEGMLAVQMASVHTVAMQCLGRTKDAFVIDQIKCLINQSVKLMRVFTAQIEALQRYRGKSTQQKVTVEHVHVHQGGQAIVGAVNHQGKGRGGGDES
jgi:hypothetical protein